MNDLRTQIKEQFTRGDGLMKLIYVNLGVFLVYILLGIVSFLVQTNFDYGMQQWLALPSSLAKLATRPWTLFTYMFFHQGFLHILFNMITLYFAGMLFRDFLGTRKLVSYYLLGGLIGGVLYILFYNLFPVFSDAVAQSDNRGASAGIMAVIIGVATFRPQMVVRVILFDVKLWIVAVVFVLLDLINLPKENAGGHIAHLGGAIFGYIAMRQYVKGKDITEGFSQFIGNIQGWFKPKPKMRTVYKNTSRATQNGRNKQHYETRLNEILDKVKDSGYDSLSKEEKDFLFKMSRD